jgi:hypothetical protein
LSSIRTLKISGLILRHELLSLPPPNFQRGNLLLEKISNRKMALQIERNRENKEQLISFVFGFNLPVTIFDILDYNKWFKTNYNIIKQVIRTPKIISLR